MNADTMDVTQFCHGEGAALLVEAMRNKLRVEQLRKSTERNIMDNKFWSNILWDIAAGLCACDYICPPLEPEQHAPDCCYRRLLQALADKRLTVSTANELIVGLNSAALAPADFVEAVAEVLAPGHVATVSTMADCEDEEIGAEIRRAPHLW